MLLFLKSPSCWRRTVALEELKNSFKHKNRVLAMHTSQELENFLVQTAAFKGKSWSLILQGLGWGAPVHLIICGCWQQICPASWNCGHWIFLTVKRWTCCFKHLYILEVQGVVGCLADFPPLALLPVASCPLLTLAGKVLVTQRSP